MTVSPRPLSRVRKSYQTSFPSGEIVNGAWRRGGSDTGGVWTDPLIVSGSPNHIRGTQISAGVTDDSIICRPDVWATNQFASAVIFLNPTLAGNFHEVELLLNFQILGPSGTVRAFGYEFNISFGGPTLETTAYQQGVEWEDLPGSGGDGTGHFVVLDQIFNAPQPVTGDVFSVSRIGSVATTRLNGVVLKVYDLTKDLNNNPRTPLTGGAPGMGFFNDGGGGADDDKFGFTSWQANEQ